MDHPAVVGREEAQVSLHRCRDLGAAEGDLAKPAERLGGTHQTWTPSGPGRGRRLSESRGTHRAVSTTQRYTPVTRGTTP